MKKITSRSMTLFGACVVFIGAYAFFGLPHATLGSQASADGVREVIDPVPSNGLEHATFALGCFWHSEEMFLELKGVHEALPGYCGGTAKNPDYETVGTGSTGYAESVDVTFDPKVISYQQLLEVFFKEHDPTSLNMQGPDEGTQYRSAVFYRNAEQKKAIDNDIASLRQAHTYSKPIVTEVAPYHTFYRAEDYHIHYFRKHPDQSYIANVTMPEIVQFRNDFPALLNK